MILLCLSQTPTCRKCGQGFPFCFGLLLIVVGRSNIRLNKLVRLFRILYVVKQNFNSIS
jgi:hypothetical protein